MAETRHKPPLDRQEAISILKAGKIEEWNAMRREGQAQGASLSKADLTGANLAGVDLAHVCLYGVTLDRANLCKADLSGADLSGSYLRDANLAGADLAFTDLGAADLSNATLNGAKLIGTDLTESIANEADYYAATFGMTRLADLDLSVARNLEGVDHVYASSIGVDTIIRSKGMIPKAFLEGCGVPRMLIDYLLDIGQVATGLQLYSCFISHSSKDADFAAKLRGGLLAGNARVWYAPEDMRSGRKSREQIEEAIARMDRLLLILSEHSMASPWVEHELRAAMRKEKETKRQVLFPIRIVEYDRIRDWECFDSDTGRDLAREVREYHIPDFAGEGGKTFAEALEELLRALRKDEHFLESKP